MISSLKNIKCLLNRSVQSFTRSNRKQISRSASALTVVGTLGSCDSAQAQNDQNNPDDDAKEQIAVLKQKIRTHTLIQDFTSLAGPVVALASMTISRSVGMMTIPLQLILNIHSNYKIDEYKQNIEHILKNPSMDYNPSCDILSLYEDRYMLYNKLNTGFTMLTFASFACVLPVAYFVMPIVCGPLAVGVGSLGMSLYAKYRAKQMRQ
jgi:hypothetical protein